MVIRLTPNGRVGQRPGRRDLGRRAGPASSRRRRCTPKPPALEIAATRWRSDTQVIAPPMMAIAAAEERGAAPATAGRAAPGRRPRRARCAVLRRRRGRRRCAARARASSVYSSAISTLTLISEVEITWMLMPFSASVLEHALGDAGMAAHADADHRDLDHIGVGHRAPRSRSRLRARLERLPRRARDRPCVDGEGQSVVSPSPETFCTIMSTLMSASASGAEDGGGDARPVGHADQRDLGLVAAIGDAADESAVPRSRPRPPPACPARRRSSTAPAARTPVLHRQLDRAGLQHLGAERGHLQHLLVGDLLELARLGNDARIGGVDAVDIGEDVAAIGLQRRRQRHRRGVRAAAAERGDRGCPGRCPGSPATTATWPCSQRRLAALGVDAPDARLAVGVVGADRDLPAQPGARLTPSVLQRDRQQAGGHLLAGRDHGVVFARVVQRAMPICVPVDELVGRAGHGGDHDRDLRCRHRPRA